MGQSLAIGVIDSGIGGLSVLQPIQCLLPQFSTLYFADQAHLPYGARPHREIYHYVEHITRFLLSQGAGVIVLACHAASAAALHELRATFPHTPFVGIEPAIKPAVAATLTGVIGVLTTQATADGHLYRRVIERFAQDVIVLTCIATQLVTIAEEQTQHLSANQTIISNLIQPLLDAGADQLVLACTHFPFVADMLKGIVGQGVELVDPGPAVARQVARVVEKRVNADAVLQHQYFTSGVPEHFSDMLERLLNVKVAVVGAEPFSL